MLTGEREKLLHLPTVLHERVVGQDEAVVDLLHPVQPLPRFLAAALGEEDAIGLLAAAADAAPQLVELSQAEPFGAVDEHDRRVGHVDADLDDARSHEKLDVAFLEGFHDGFLVLTLHAAVDEATRPLGKDGRAQLVVEGCRRLQIDGLRFLDEGADDVTLLALGHQFIHEDVDAAAHVLADGIGLDDLAARRQLVDGRDIQVAVHG